ncbi:MAG: DUF1028 domain-containing protein [Anaerolineae bacterium]|nr:DUF1028 domain-containing protein [Anaerolineae bacterium]MBT7073488.1 DUF1028 domain-containing protein [Anaerolineae bacterium]MBT7783692.1 DUF1028 domain-containing protein [Anaerolineae bacterium]
MPRFSTFSIVACDLKTKTWGIAVASKFPAVGAAVPWVQAEVGAVATQSYVNTSYGPNGLEMMAEGVSAEETLEKLLANDEQREIRQVGLVDAQGHAVTFTGKKCHDWAGGVTGPGYAIQGNILTGANVIQDMETTFLDTEGDLPARLYAALYAGDRSGGDKRGRQAAAIYVAKPKGGYGGFLDRWIDYRVDNALDPVPELGELLELHELYMGTSPESERVKLEGVVLRNLQKIMVKLGYYQPKIDGIYTETVKEALNSFLGNENFENRFHPEEGYLDQPVVNYLIKKFKK